VGNQSPKRGFCVQKYMRSGNVEKKAAKGGRLSLLALDSVQALLGESQRGKREEQKKKTNGFP
jgi:hypothetical protein